MKLHDVLGTILTVEDLSMKKKHIDLAELTLAGEQHK